MPPDGQAVQCGQRRVQAFADAGIVRLVDNAGCTNARLFEAHDVVDAPLEIRGGAHIGAAHLPCMCV